jgi:hypothetical protein
VSYGIVASVILASGGTYIAIHETRRRERKVTRKEIDDLTREINKYLNEVHQMRVIMLEQRRYIYKLMTLMIDAGMNPPQPPGANYDPDEYLDDKPDEI